MKNPCYDEVNHKDCPGRHAGCACDCPAWAEYVRQRDQEYQRRRLETEANCVKFDSIERRNKAAHKRFPKHRRKRNLYNN